MAKTPLKWLAKRDFLVFGQKTRGGFYAFEGIVAGCDTCKTGKSEEKEKKSKHR